jgi:hypothetical protein
MEELVGGDDSWVGSGLPEDELQLLKSKVVKVVVAQNCSKEYKIAVEAMKQLFLHCTVLDPHVGECLNRMSGARIFSTGDALSGFWQILLKIEDRLKTAFATDEGYSRGDLYCPCQAVGKVIQLCQGDVLLHLQALHGISCINEHATGLVDQYFGPCIHISIRELALQSISYINGQIGHILVRVCFQSVA